MKPVKTDLTRGMVLFLLLLTITFKISSQIKGTVTDEKGLALPGVTIQEKGTSNGTITNNNGGYSLTVKNATSELVFSYIGMETKTIKVENKKNIDVTLVEESKSIKEVIVVGYGNQKKITVTGSVSTINSSQILKTPASNLALAMTGKLPGLSTVQRTGAPGGESPEIYIRGIGNPIVIVDGVERSGGGAQTSGSNGATSGYEQIDPNEIETISILKDASSTAVFGVRGANGVIIITTKKGILSAPKVNYSYNLSLNSPVKLPRTTNSYEWFSYMNEAMLNDGLPPVISASDLENYRLRNDPVLYPDLDYNEFILRDFSPRKQHNLNIRGGNEYVKYFVSGGYLNEEGIIKQNAGYGFNPNWSFKRYNLRSNLDFQFTKRLSMSVNLEARFENRQGLMVENEGTFFWRMYKALPYVSPGFVNNKLVITRNEGEKPIHEWIMKFGTYYNNQTSLNSIFNLKYDLDFITKGLLWRVKYAYDSWNFDRYARRRTYETFQPVVYNEQDTNADGITDSYDIAYRKTNEDINGPLVYADNVSSKARSIYLETALEWSQTYNDHGFSALLLYNQSKNFYTAGPPLDIPRSYLGVVTRVTYNYAHKYLAEFNFGMNGSENFPKGKRFGKFPAYSLGWVASREDFLKDNPVVSFLKFRASHGTVGNDRIGGNRFLYVEESFKPLSGGLSPRPGFGDQGNWWYGSNPMIEGRPANLDITWEVARKTDFAIELNMFKDKLSMIVDFFYENRDNILTTMQNIPSFMIPQDHTLELNLISPVNYSVRTNKGFEAEMKFADQIGKLNYSLGGAFSYAVNKEKRISETYQYYPWRFFQGQSLGQPYGLICEGFYQSYDEILSGKNPVSTFTSNIVPGDLKYKDINGDMKIDNNDMVPIGYSNIPQITYSFFGDISYKNLNLSFLFSGADQVSYLPQDEGRIQMMNGITNAFSDIIKGRWTPENRQTASYPILHGSSLLNTHHNYQNSTFWMWDASYIRLKNVQIGYRTDTPNLKRWAGIDNIYTYINGQNLFTISDLFIDPEAVNNKLVLYPVMKTYNIGINVSF